MSYNYNFSRDYFPHENTFQRPEFIPPPPPPPTFFIPPTFNPTSEHDNDVNFVKRYDNLPKVFSKYKPQRIPINAIKEKLHNIVFTLNSLKEKEKFLNENLNTMSDSEWDLLTSEIQKEKQFLNESLGTTNDFVDLLRRALAKRSAKRLRQKRVRQEKKKEKDNRMKEQKEKSRKIDEYLQKVKDEILKAKQEEDAKLEADIVLKEVLRKKHDAKKYLIKLDALLKLHRARQNTARGRGEDVSERDAESFSKNIEKLKTLWNGKLHQYEKEESDLRASLKRHDEQDGGTEDQCLANLASWRRFMFGGGMPQVDFDGNFRSFVAVRSQWDQYINAEGSALPVGWIVPHMNDQE